MSWHYEKDGQPQGPVSVEVLIHLIQSGLVPRQVRVWQPGQQGWAPADSIPELASQLPAGSVPPAPSPATPSAAGGFRCPYCQSQAMPVVRSKISTGGWVVFIILLLFCICLCWIGLLMKEQERFCAKCGMRLG